MSEITKRPIAVELRSLPVNGRSEFPIEQSGSVKAAISRLKVEMSRMGWLCRVSDDKSRFVTIVERVS